MTRFSTRNSYALETAQPLLLRQDRAERTLELILLEIGWGITKSFFFHSQRSRGRDLNTAHFRVILIRLVFHTRNGFCQATIYCEHFLMRTARIIDPDLVRMEDSVGARRSCRREFGVQSELDGLDESYFDMEGCRVINRIRVLLVDDHALFREGLAGIVGSQSDMQVVGEASDGLEALVKAQNLKPDLILMDVQMPGKDGPEATRQIKQVLPETIIVMLTVRDDNEKLFEALKNGAQGYLLKEIHSRDMLAMIRGAIHGEAALSPSLANRVLAEFRRLSLQLPPYQFCEGDELAKLTPRELDILMIAAQDASDKEIAGRLTISVPTVKSHIRSILSKLHVNTRREAARMARSRGLL